LLETFVKISPNTTGLKSECGRIAELLEDIAALLKAYAAGGSLTDDEAAK
jgi:hypothetical protein